MNWGHKIILVFVLFAAGILTLVIKSMQTRIDMASPNYYAEELRHQEQMNATANAARLSAPVKIAQEGARMAIHFPEEMTGAQLSGTLHFYRPSDSRRDLRLDLAPDAQGAMYVDRSLLLQGNYRVKLQWEANGQQYYQETSCFIQ
ncbi:FixH family protein [Chitinophaga lutea]